MTAVIHPTFHEHALDAIPQAKGLVVICIDAAGSFGPSAKRVNRLMKGTLKRFAGTEIFENMVEGDIQRFPAPLGLAADAVLLLKMKKRPTVETARKSGANIAKEAGNAPINLFVTANSRAAQMAFGITLRRYRFDAHKSNDAGTFGDAQVYITNVEKNVNSTSCAC